MITPNKLISLAHSSLGQVDKIFNAFEERTSVTELYKKLKFSFESVDLFIYAIETLYLVDVLEVDFNTGMISKC
ncbi:ABC-three component system middle component 7 [Pseudomonas syringae]|uniref:ABC-three component system middle component 7 n=1 Tax=Pseudomonas syringae TaxID=317 RepID=UPI000EFFB60D